MPTVYLSPITQLQPLFVPGGNTPGAGAQLFCYVARSSTKQNMYTTSSGAVAWANPLVLDSGGNVAGSNEIWQPASSPAKYVLAPSNDTDPPTSPYWTMDDIAGINDSAGGLAEWVAAGTPTFVSATQMTLVGDQSATFDPGRRIKATVTAGTVYATVITATFAAGTTTVTVAGGALDSGLSAVSYGLLDPANPSIDFYHVDRQAAAVLTASATTNIWGTDGNSLHLTSNVVIGSFSSAPYVGARKRVVADTAFTLQHSSTTLLVPGGINKSVAVGDVFEVYADTVSKMLVVNYSASSGAAPVSSILQNFMSGLTIAVTNSTGTVSTAAGIAADKTNSAIMTLLAQTNKTATSWAASTGAGGLLDAGPVSTLAWYHWHLIARSDNGWVDIGYSSSATAPPLPSGYGISRRFASLKTNAASTWTGVTQFDDTFMYSSSFADVNAVSINLATSTFALTTPLGLRTEAIVGAATGAALGLYIFPTTAQNEVPSATHATMRSGGGTMVSPMRVYTNTSSQINTCAEGGLTITLFTYGYLDMRGR